MKLKSNVISIIIAASFLLAGINIQAQGIFREENRTTDDQMTISSNDDVNSRRGGGIFRDDDDDWGGDDDDRPEDPPGDSPIGEGLLFLSLLTGGYALVKRNVRKKYEE